jgi:hypothetical protein
MPDFVNTFFEERVEQLFDLAGLAERLFSSAGLEYWIAGGLAVYLYVEEVEPDAGRLTRTSISLYAAPIWRRSRKLPQHLVSNIATWRESTCWFGLTNPPDVGPSICILRQRRNSAPTGESENFA